MPPSLLLSLQITLVGMGLVFAAILLLWALMAVLVRLTAERGPQGGVAERQLRERAAAVAVAAALERARQAPAQFPLPPTAFVSAWQAVMRAGRLRQRGPVR